MGTVKEEAKRFFREINAELNQQAVRGAEELAAGLLRHHDGFVMYGGKDEQQQPIVQLELQQDLQPDQQQQQTQHRGHRL